MTAIEAVVFDCDGVIADSEGITNGVLREMLGELGWELTQEECLARFAGHALRDLAPTFEQHTGAVITDAWIAEFRRRRDERLRIGVTEIPGAGAAVRRAVDLFPGRVALASGADRAKIEMQLTTLGLLDAFAGQVHSGLEHPRTKPWPDVYVAAITQLGADPARTAIVEDTVAGVQAGVAAGARVWGYAPGDAVHTPAELLRAAGAEIIVTDMADLIPSILTAPPS